ncbi:hypothetical protein PCASD_18575 [Puccinia coronata f. sp. avenae]|uniref:Tet-like 2OG-Fe(II) oxygenase domain-containing protein n=1 Tax=Puccinia coronata f. sp. avenae TaxID=200324 RepID=A0A2N5TT08_9BASI|nr:hypothetical protein PCASD_18575 [Puccinia coronata f. sp. avenae]
MRNRKKLWNSGKLPVPGCTSLRASLRTLLRASCDHLGATGRGSFCAQRADLRTSCDHVGATDCELLHRINPTPQAFCQNHMVFLQMDGINQLDNSNQPATHPPRIPRKRKRPQKNINRWAACRQKAAAPFAASAQPNPLIPPPELAAALVIQENGTAADLPSQANGLAAEPVVREKGTAADLTSPENGLASALVVRDNNTAANLTSPENGLASALVVRDNDTAADLASQANGLATGPIDHSPAAQADTKAVYFYWVSHWRQVDPFPAEMKTSAATLRNHYARLSHGTCVIAHRGQEAFCKVQFVPFKSMSSTEVTGWEKLVCHFLNRTQYIAEVKNNGPQLGGCMFADGWRKCFKQGEAFGRYCCVGKLREMMRLTNYDPENKAAEIKDATNFIACQLEHLAPGVLAELQRTLIKNRLPSMAHMEYPTPYDDLDFASFMTFTLYNFYNKPHVNGDENWWTLVCWIPIFNPRNSSETNPILADDGFDMWGGEFTFRKSQVYLDLNEVLGVTICVFESNSHEHQTLYGESPSNKYTRLGFSCQMSETMTEAVVKCLKKDHTKPAVAGQAKQIENAQKEVTKKKKK